jgi:hypothetical protein
MLFNNNNNNNKTSSVVRNVKKKHKKVLSFGVNLAFFDMDRTLAGELNKGMTCIRLSFVSASLFPLDLITTPLVSARNMCRFLFFAACKAGVELAEKILPIASEMGNPPMYP